MQAKHSLSNIYFLANQLADVAILRLTLSATDGEEEARLVPRSRVAAALVVSSANTVVFRNILQNPESAYELGSHLEDQSQVVNCTFNWLGSSSEEKLFNRVFHR